MLKRERSETPGKPLALLEEGLERGRKRMRKNVEDKYHISTKNSNINNRADNLERTICNLQRQKNAIEDQEREVAFNAQKLAQDMCLDLATSFYAAVPKPVREIVYKFLNSDIRAGVGSICHIAMNDTSRMLHEHWQKAQYVGRDFAQEVAEYQYKNTSYWFDAQTLLHMKKFLTVDPFRPSLIPRDWLGGIYIRLVRRKTVLKDLKYDLRIKKQFGALPKDARICIQIVDTKVTGYRHIQHWASTSKYILYALEFSLRCLIPWKISHCGGQCVLWLFEELKGHKRCHSELHPDAVTEYLKIGNDLRPVLNRVKRYRIKLGEDRCVRLGLHPERLTYRIESRKAGKDQQCSRSGVLSCFRCEVLAYLDLFRQVGWPDLRGGFTVIA
ncbi:hypothetical protein BDV95DRAFT_178000 [Massariosphaeria phaeospora]|uniref:Uncharacterized protein n=1 Tax=Massariosphaeria phaeospora TaxID=100035 RepID=A0A7C8I293_9PLEO|nr:hypothetical protein BDV95DRAFT_178000 [Massariosphaeria phaeospora]